MLWGDPTSPSAARVGGTQAGQRTQTENVKSQRCSLEQPLIQGLQFCSIIPLTTIKCTPPLGLTLFLALGNVQETGAVAVLRKLTSQAGDCGLCGRHGWGLGSWELRRGLFPEEAFDPDLHGENGQGCCTRRSKCRGPGEQACVWGVRNRKSKSCPVMGNHGELG